MLAWEFTLLLISVSEGAVPKEVLNLLMMTVPTPENHGGTPSDFEEKPNLVIGPDIGYGAGQRGPTWYDDTSDEKSHPSSLGDSGGSSASLNSDSSKKDKQSSGASSKESKDKRRATRMFRDCTPCPIDMVRKYKNLGIKWICAKYQRARRSFKSECMMRYRNCQDGTMFVKIMDNRCTENTTAFGRSWFYIYKV